MIEYPEIIQQTRNQIDREIIIKKTFSSREYVPSESAAAIARPSPMPNVKNIAQYYSKK
jgi:hypothetical protein